MNWEAATADYKKSWILDLEPKVLVSMPIVLFSIESMFGYLTFVNLHDLIYEMGTAQEGHCEDQWQSFEIYVLGMKHTAKKELKWQCTNQMGLDKASYRSGESGQEKLL